MDGQFWICFCILVCSVQDVMLVPALKNNTSLTAKKRLNADILLTTSPITPILDCAPSQCLMKIPAIVTKTYTAMKHNIALHKESLRKFYKRPRTKTTFHKTDLFTSNQFNYDSPSNSTDKSTQFLFESHQNVTDDANNTLNFKNNINISKLPMSGKKVTTKILIAVLKPFATPLIENKISTPTVLMTSQVKNESMQNKHFIFHTYGKKVTSSEITKIQLADERKGVKHFVLKNKQENRKNNNNLINKKQAVSHGANKNVLKSINRNNNMRKIQNKNTVRNQQPVRDVKIPSNTVKPNIPRGTSAKPTTVPIRKIPINRKNLIDELDYKKIGNNTTNKLSTNRNNIPNIKDIIANLDYTKTPRSTIAKYNPAFPVNKYDYVRITTAKNVKSVTVNRKITTQRRNMLNTKGNKRNTALPSKRSPLRPISNRKPLDSFYNKQPTFPTNFIKYSQSTNFFNMMTIEPRSSLPSYYTNYPYTPYDYTTFSPYIEVYTTYSYSSHKTYSNKDYNDGTVSTMFSNQNNNEPNRDYNDQPNKSTSKYIINDYEDANSKTTTMKSSSQPDASNNDKTDEEYENSTKNSENNDGNDEEDDSDKNNNNHDDNNDNNDDTESTDNKNDQEDEDETENTSSNNNNRFTTRPSPSPNLKPTENNFKTSTKEMHSNGGDDYSESTKDKENLELIKTTSPKNTMYTNSKGYTKDKNKEESKDYNDHETNDKPENKPSDSRNDKDNKTDEKSHENNSDVKDHVKSGEKDDSENSNDEEKESKGDSSKDSSGNNKNEESEDDEVEKDSDDDSKKDGDKEKTPSGNNKNEESEDDEAESSGNSKNEESEDNEADSENNSKKDGDKEKKTSGNNKDEESKDDEAEKDSEDGAKEKDSEDREEDGNDNKENAEDEEQTEDSENDKIKPKSKNNGKNVENKNSGSKIEEEE